MHQPPQENGKKKNHRNYIKSVTFTDFVLISLFERPDAAKKYPQGDELSLNLKNRQVAMLFK